MASTALEGGYTVVVRAPLNVEVVKMAVFPLVWLVSSGVAVHAAFVRQDIHHGLERISGRQVSSKGNECDEGK
jgi:hypothetical protein